MRLDAAPLRDLPAATRWLVGLSFAGWLAELLLGLRVNLTLGLVPYLFAHQFWLWQGVTYIFIHASFWHFLFNAFMLWMLGRLLEPEMGTRKFLLYFLGCGLAAAAVTAGWNHGSLTPVVGASGAVFGLLGAFAFLNPEATVYFYFLFPMSARTMALLLGAMEFALTLARPGSGISNVTHLGGLAAGVAWLWLERRWRERPARFEPDPEQLERAEVDALLEKVSRKGQAALSRAELAKLDAFAKRRGGRA
ncbi:MAG: rhomboid family intramembrane serine protease [Elusimicrobia bacterium]|jgi:membrane associated rhomboid family serine protease|nr:rhomboid family intramembrane serine protease [Elusimicrobiota bacterium]